MKAVSVLLLLLCIFSKLKECHALDLIWPEPICFASHLLHPISSCFSCLVICLFNVRVYVPFRHGTLGGVALEEATARGIFCMLFNIESATHQHVVYAVGMMSI